MALYECLEPDFTFADERGKLFQLVHEGFAQVNILESRQGTTRGGHYHKTAVEAFFVISGRVTVLLRAGEESSERTFCAGDFFLIRPPVVHSMRFPEDCVLAALYDVPVEREDGTKDIYPEEV